MTTNTSRPIPPHVPEEEIRFVLRHLNEGFAWRCAGIRCPRHGTRPRVEFKASRAEGIFTEALVCCEELDDLVAAHVRRHLIEHPVGGWRYGG